VLGCAPPSIVSALLLTGYTNKDISHESAELT